jgi:hypothetical protein
MVFDFDYSYFSQLWRSAVLEHQRMPISQIRKKDHPQLSLKSFGLFDLISAQ